MMNEKGDGTGKLSERQRKSQSRTLKFMRIFQAILRHEREEIRLAGAEMPGTSGARAGGVFLC